MKTPITSLILSSLLLVALFIGARMTGYAASYKVAPKNAGDNLFNAGMADSILRGKHSLGVFERAKLGANLSDLFRGKQAIANYSPALVPHIINVVLVSTNEKMVRTNARRIIAVMANDHFRGNLALCKNQRKNVSALAKCFAECKNTIAVFIPIASPVPASVTRGFLNMRPELCGHIGSAAKVGAGAAAIFSTSPVESGSQNREKLLAVLTGERNSGVIKSNHFKSSKFDLARDTRARQRSGISLKTKPLYHKTATPAAKNSINNSTAAQTCTLAVQHSLGSCTGVNVGWFTQTAQASIARFDLITFAGNFTVPNTARSYSIQSGCSSGGAVRVIEVRTNGATCILDFTGNLPHARSCDSCQGVGARFAVRNAADYQSDLSADSIAAAFPDPGAPFSTVTEGAFSLPLPRTLGGVRVYVAEIECGLFYTAPNQVNFHVPSLPPGLHAARITTQDGRTMFGDVLINENAPGIFTADGTGQGRAASYWINSPGVAYLVMFGTGFQAGNCELRLGNGRRYQAQYCGNAPGFVGLSQMNYAIPTGELWQGQIGATVRVSSFAGFWDSQGVLVAR